MKHLIRALVTLVAALAAVVTLLTPTQASAEPGELSLYGVVLRTATVPEFLAAAWQAGVSSVKEGGTTTVYDAKGAGVPGLVNFQLITRGQQIVAVQFEVSANLEASHALRKMLLAKYGRPDLSETMFGGGQGFDSPYLSNAKAQWKFIGGMKLIYKTDFPSSSARLTYVDEARFASVMDQAKSQSDREASDKARRLTDKF